MATSDVATPPISRRVLSCSFLSDYLHRRRLERGLRCDVSSHTLAEWAELRQQYLDAGGTDERWHELAEERVADT